MANYATLKAAVAAVVKSNGNKDITGTNMQSTLIGMIDSIAGGYLFKGVATPSTSPGTPDQNVFYIGGAGTYTNFGDSYTVPQGSVGMFYYNGSWARASANILEFVDTLNSFDADKALSANQGRNLMLRIGELNKDTISIKFSNIGEYINSSGIVKYNPNNKTFGATDYIPVQSGDMFEYDMYFVSSSSDLSYCWGYDEDFQPVSELVSFLTGGKSGSFTVNDASIKYIKAFSVISGHYIESLSSLNAKLLNVIDKLYSEIFIRNFINYGTFIREDGQIVSGSQSAATTDFIAVDNGQVFDYDFGFTTSGTTLSYCWGYDDTKTPVSEIVPFTSGTSVRGTFTINNQNIKYIRAFSKIDEGHFITLKDSIEERIESQENKHVVWNYITVGSGDNAIRTAMAGITDATEYNRYIIIVPDGLHFECDLKGKKYVKIKGQSRNGTIIYCDGTSSKTTPSDYTYTDYRSVALNTIPRSQKHIIYPSSDLDIENVTLRAISCKYCVHFEDSGWNDAHLSNCIFEGEDVLSLVGYGLRGSQTCLIEDSLFRGYNDDEPNAMYIHNWYWERTTALNIPLYGGGACVKVKNGLFECNGDYLLRIGEIASMNDDRIIFDNCDISDASKVITWMVEKNEGIPYARDLNGDSIQDPLDVPYCIQLQLIKVYTGTDDISFTQTERPDYTNMVSVVK